MKNKSKLDYDFEINLSIFHTVLTFSERNHRK